MNPKVKYIVLTLHIKQLDTRFRFVEVVRIMEPVKRKLKNWRPVIGERIPNGIPTSPETDGGEKIILVLNEQERDFVEGLERLDFVTNTSSGLVSCLEDLCARSIDGVLGELDPE